MKKLFYSAFAYTIIGLLSGLYYRELTKAQDFAGETQLAVVHTHLLVLGTLVFLLAMVLERSFGISRSKLFTWFFWLFSAGLVLTVGMLVVHGTMTVMGAEAGAAIAGIAGIGHILLTAGFVIFFLALRSVAFGVKSGSTNVVTADA